MPVAPEKITYKIKNNNKAIDLMNGGALNVLRQPGLTEISFTLLIPACKYPFSHPEGFKEQDYFLALFKELKMGLKPFNFNIHRVISNKTELAEISMMVSLESYTITEKAEDIGGVEVEINLKEYDEHLTSYTVKNGDSLWVIAKLQLGDETKWKALAAKNNIEPPYIVMPGQVIQLG